MDPTNLLSSVFGALAGKTPLHHLWLLAVAVVIWWVWRETMFRPIHRKVTRK